MPKSKHNRVNRKSRRTIQNLLNQPVPLNLSSQGEDGHPTNELQRLRQAESRFHAQRADKVRAVEEFDGFATLRNKLRILAEDRGEWAGYPLPIQGERLVVEPTYPRAEELMAIWDDPKEPKEDLNGVAVRNRFWSDRLRAYVTIVDDNGKLFWWKEPGIHNLTHQLRTLGCSYAWGIEQESNAVNTLAGLLSHHQMKCYLLTGSFVEKSRRSKLMYMFRKLRPTVAIDLSGVKAKVRCALCMHPIAYYEGTWAGAMCPTDDVIAHLMLMRADEPMLWRRCNQHPSNRPEAGL